MNAELADYAAKPLQLEEGKPCARRRRAAQSRRDPEIPNGELRVLRLVESRGERDYIELFRL
jgi:hypothetical protein